MGLESGVVMWCAEGHIYSSNSTPSLGTSICCGCSPKKKKKEKKSRLIIGMSLKSQLPDLTMAKGPGSELGASMPWFLCQSYFTPWTLLPGTSLFKLFGCALASFLSKIVHVGFDTSWWHYLGSAYSDKSNACLLGAMWTVRDASGGQASTQ